MKKLIVAAVLTAIVGVLAASASASASAGRVGGSFSTGSLAGLDDKAEYISGSQVWCQWRGNHVTVHVKLHNSSVETITATVKPRYYIARGSEHRHVGVQSVGELLHRAADRPKKRRLIYCRHPGLREFGGLSCVSNWLRHRRERFYVDRSVGRPESLDV